MKHIRKIIMATLCIASTEKHLISFSFSMGKAPVETISPTVQKDQQAQSDLNNMNISDQDIQEAQRGQQFLNLPQNQQKAFLASTDIQAQNKILNQPIKKASTGWSLFTSKPSLDQQLNNITIPTDTNPETSSQADTASINSDISFQAPSDESYNNNPQINQMTINNNDLPLTAANLTLLSPSPVSNPKITPSISNSSNKSSQQSTPSTTSSWFFSSKKSNAPIDTTTGSKENLDEVKAQTQQNIDDYKNSEEYQTRLAARKASGNTFIPNSKPSAQQQAQTMIQDSTNQVAARTQGREQVKQQQIHDSKMETVTQNANVNKQIIQQNNAQRAQKAASTPTPAQNSGNSSWNFWSTSPAQ